jgi:type I restriction enzyme, S subunit
MKTVKLGDICNLMTGGTPSRSNKEYFGGDIKWLVSGDIHKSQIYDCEGRITELGLKNSNARLLPINSVMIALNGQGKTRATVAMLRTEATCNQSLVSIYPKDDSEVLPEYIYWNLKGRYEEMRKMTGDSGNDRRGLNMILLRNIDIPKPPAIDEQRRIVERLDAAFEKIDRAIELTDENGKKAASLFEVSLQNLISRPPAEWTKQTLKDIAVVTMGQSPAGSTYNNNGDGLPLINGPVEFGPSQFSKTRVTKYTNKPTKLCKEDELILCVRGSTTGRTNVALGNACLGRGVASIRAKDGVDQKLINILISGLRNYIYSIGTGATFPNVSSNQLNDLEIAIPEKLDQRKLASNLFDKYEKSLELQSLYNKKSKILRKLKQSMLAESFSESDVK